MRGAHPGGAPQAAPNLRACPPDGKRMQRRHLPKTRHISSCAGLSAPQRCPSWTDAYQLMCNVAFAHKPPNRHRLRSSGCSVESCDAAPNASEPRASVAGFKHLLKPDVRDLVGIATYERPAARSTDTMGATSLHWWAPATVAGGAGPAPPNARRACATRC